MYIVGPHLIKVYNHADPGWSKDPKIGDFNPAKIMEQDNALVRRGRHASDGVLQLKERKG